MGMKEEMEQKIKISNFEQNKSKIEYYLNQMVICVWFGVRFHAFILIVAR